MTMVIYKEPNSDEWKVLDSAPIPEKLCDFGYAIDERGLSLLNVVGLM